MIKMIAIFIFSTLVQLLTWESAREASQRKLQDYFTGERISERHVTRYQIAVVVFKSSVMTMVCMDICACYRLFLSPY